MHFDVVLSVFIHPCTQKQRRAQFSIRSEFTRLSVRARALDVCACARFSAQKTSHTALKQTRASFMLTLCLRGSHYIESWHVRLNENARVGGNAKTDIMWKCGQCLNKGAFLYDRYRYFTRGIDASYRHTLYRSISMNRYTPTKYIVIL